MARNTRSRGRPTDYTWDGLSSIVIAIDLTDGTAVLGTTALAFGDKQTITRIRGSMLFSLDPSGADELVVIAVGIIVVSTQALLAGEASVPDPFDSIGSPFIWYQFVILGGPDLVTNTGVMQKNQRVEVDAKAMRRVGLDESMAVKAQVAIVDGDAGGTWDWSYGLRVLTGK